MSVWLGDAEISNGTSWYLCYIAAIRLSENGQLLFGTAEFTRRSIPGSNALRGACCTMKARCTVITRGLRKPKATRRIHLEGVMRGLPRCCDMLQRAWLITGKSTQCGGDVSLIARTSGHTAWNF